MRTAILPMYQCTLKSLSEFMLLKCYWIKEVGFFMVTFFYLNFQYDIWL